MSQRVIHVISVRNSHPFDLNIDSFVQIPPTPVLYLCSTCALSILYLYPPTPVLYLCSIYTPSILHLHLIYSFYTTLLLIRPFRPFRPLRPLYHTFPLTTSLTTSLTNELPQSLTRHSPVGHGQSPRRDTEGHQRGRCEVHLRRPCHP